MSRATAMSDFLSRSPWSDAEVTPLAGDASARRYFRLAGGSIVMDAPPDAGQNTARFVDMTARLRGRGLSAPEIRHADAELGFLVLEDLGDALFARVLETAEEGEERRLYSAALDVLLTLHAAPELADGLPDYDLSALMEEALLVVDWYMPAFGSPATAAVHDTFVALVTQAVAKLSPAGPVCTLRDYHAENLIWLPEREGTGRVGLLDYQDALAGHPAYDLVSLLEDARRDVGESTREAALARYAAVTGQDRATLDLDLAILGAQRNLKILGIFARLCLRDGKPRYGGLMPRVWGHLMRDLTHPVLDGLRTWVAQQLKAPEPARLDRLSHRT